MNIAYINLDAGVPAFGSKGASVHVQEMMRAFLKRGAQIDLFAARLGGEPPRDLAGTRVHHLALPADADAAGRERNALAANARVGVELNLLAEATGIDLVYERYSLWSFAALEFARDHGIPSVLEVNAPLIDEQAKHRALIDRAAAEEVTSRAFSAASVITVVSRQLAAIIERHPAARGKVRVTPNAVNPERFAQSTAAVARSEGDFVIGFLGTLKPWHGLETLISAFESIASQLPRAKLLIVGDGPERERLQQLLASAGLAERAIFAGAVTPERVPDFLASMDVAVAPYPPLEEFYFSPLKVFEYMAAGLPTVASNIGQVQDVIVHGKTGWLVPPGDARALELALMELAAGSAMRESLGAAARSEVFAKHTWDSVAARVLEWAGVNENTER
jgi:glycosyltransferase involved in cell wall biosynthesis